MKRQIAAMSAKARVRRQRRNAAILDGVAKSSVIAVSLIGLALFFHAIALTIYAL